MKSVSFNVLILGLATAISLVACDRGDRKTTPNDAILKAQCRSQTGGYSKGNIGFFSTEKFSTERAEAISSFSADNRIVRTYVVKAKVDTGNLKVISKQKVEELNASSDSIQVTDVNCDTLKATLVMQGAQIPEMDIIASKDMRKAIALTKQITVKNAEGKDVIETINVTVGEVVADSKEQKAIDAAHGKRVLKLSYKSAPSVNQDLEIIQVSGNPDGSSITFDKTVESQLQALTGKTYDQLKEEQVEEAKVTAEKSKSPLNEFSVKSLRESPLSIPEVKLLSSNGNGSSTPPPAAPPAAAPAAEPPAGTPSGDQPSGQSAPDAPAPDAGAPAPDAAAAPGSAS